MMQPAVEEALSSLRGCKINNEEATELFVFILFSLPYSDIDKFRRAVIQALCIKEEVD